MGKWSCIGDQCAFFMNETKIAFGTYKADDAMVVYHYVLKYRQ